MEKFNSEKLFNIHDINVCSEIEGPGRRYVIWFQGCSIGCDGCFNKELQSFNINKLVSLSELLDDIRLAVSEYKLSGVTFLGGEPTEQQNLQSLVDEVVKLDLDILLFTGKKYEDLITELREKCKWIVDGKFKSDLVIEENLIGSSNQRLFEYGKEIDISLLKSNRIDIEILEDKVKISGSMNE